jgi:hypothetical protein
MINKIYSRSIMVGERLDLEDPNLAQVVYSIDRLLHGASPVNPLVTILPHHSLVKLPATRIALESNTYFTTKMLYAQMCTGLDGYLGLDSGGIKN